MAASAMDGVYSLLDDERLVADFFNALQGAKGRGFSDALTTTMPTDSEVELHAWLGTVRPMREWIGEAIGKELGNFKAFLRNVDYESTMDVQKGDLRRDKTGGIRRRIGDLGDISGQQRDILITDLIKNGETATGAAESGFRDLSGRAYDNQAFFDTDHNESGSNQTNDLTVTEVPSANVSDTAAPTVTEMEGIITEGIGRFYGLKNDAGQPINGGITEFTVMVADNLYWAAATGAINSLNLASGASNRLAGMIGANSLKVNMVYNARLSTGQLKVYIFANASGTGPFIWQEEVPITIQESGADDAKQKFISVISSGTHAAGYGLWQRGEVILLS